MESAGAGLISVPAAMTYGYEEPLMSQVPRVLDPGASPLAAFGARVRTLRERRGMSQARLGREVHVSGDLIGKIEKAERRPLPDLVSRLDIALCANGDLIRAGTWLAQRSSGSARTTAASPGRPSRHDVIPNGPPAPEVVAGVREVLTGCRRLDHVVGSRAVLATVATQVEIAAAFLPASHGRQRQDLLATLGQLHQLAGWLAFDRTEMPAAAGAFQLAAEYAEAAGDAALMAFVLGPSHGFAATYSRRPSDGVHLGQAALAWARRAGNPRLTAFVQATTARGYARLGDARSCLALLEEAERQLGRCEPEEPVPDWLTVFDAAALDGHRGSCLLDLNRPGRAVAALDAQDAAAPRCFARNRAIWLLDRTRAHLDLSDFEAACHSLDQVLPLTRMTSSRRIDARVRESAATLTPHRSNRVVGDVLDRVRTMCLAGDLTGRPTTVS